MQPVTLRTERLVLDLPVERDIELVTHYCQDPLFERFLTTPWPYTEAHARGFLTDYVPEAWLAGTELAWAIRTEVDRPLMGIISLRTGSREIGFWLGAAHRGTGVVAEATTALCDWAFAGGVPGIQTIVWRANEGNVASAMVARASGFHNTSTAGDTVPGRDGVDLPGWNGERGATLEPGAYESWESILGGAR